MSEIPKRFWTADLEERLQKAVENYNLPERHDFSNLEELSQRTEFDGIEVHSSAAVLSKDKLFAPATIYVTLNYSENQGGGEEPISFSDTYPAKITFSLDGDNVVVEKVDVDTSSFFE